MTIEQLEQRIEGRKVLRHQGQCFVNVYSEEQALEFRELGAHVRPAGGQQHPITHQKEWGTPTWGVFLVGLMDPVTVVSEGLGKEIDVTGDFLLQHFRERDGYSGQGRYATLFA